jgi:hypothetical protein
MASVQTCVTKSITLQPGEPFNLPAGAEIISATDINSLSSTCPLPSDLEELECYIFVLAANVDNVTGTIVWEGCPDCNAYMPSITVGGTTYTFPSAFTADDRGKFDVAGLAAYIASNSSINGVMLNVGIDNDYDFPRGGVATLCFQTPPSVAAETYVTLYTQVIGLGLPAPTSVVRVYARKLSEYTGGAGTCACS